MVRINEAGFAQKICEYYHDRNKSEGWFHPSITLSLDDASVQSTLCIPYQDTQTFGDNTFSSVRTAGIRFGYNTRLMLDLLMRSYSGLVKKVSIDTFSFAVANSLQIFAIPFPDGQDTLAYPHFLFHGIVHSTLEKTIERLQTNGRIIHETLNVRNEIIKNGKLMMDNTLMTSMDYGATDDYFGIAYLLAKQDHILLSSTTGYIAKASFFMDVTNKEVYIMTIQGRRFKSSDLVYGEFLSEDQRTAAAQREYSRIGNVLGMGPRRFIVEKVVEFGKANNFSRIKVIKPNEHGMFIESHEGFHGNYERVAKQAGITEDNGCYLEKAL